MITWGPFINYGSGGRGGPEENYEGHGKKFQKEKSQKLSCLMRAALKKNKLTFKSFISSEYLVLI